MAKPISSRELLARINSVLRRRRMMDSRRAANQVSFKGLVLDTASGQATIDGTPVSLSKAEFLILGMLLRNRGQFFERIEINMRHGTMCRMYRTAPSTPQYHAYVKNSATMAVSSSTDRASAMDSWNEPVTLCHA